MRFIFTPEMRSAIQKRLEDAGNDPDHNYKPVYQYIFDQITDYTTIELETGNYTVAAPKAGLEKSEQSVWIWGQGALGVNSNDNSFFSNYIREWTATEFMLNNRVQV